MATEIPGHIEEKTCYEFLMHRSLWQSFDGEFTGRLGILSYQLGLPDMEFIDADLESLRAKFAADLYKALNAMSLIIFPHHSMNGWFTTGGEATILMSPRADEISQKINETDALNSKTANSYRALYDLVRQKLGLDLRFTNSLPEESDHSLD